MDKCKLCRKFGTKLFLKGPRCLSAKCSLTRRDYRPGAQGAKGKRVRKSEYGLQLQEKQKAKAEYGLRERQFANIFSKAAKNKENTGEMLFRLLELRLDNIVYRLGWGASRAQARQLVLHRKILVNNKILNIPSAVLKEKDTILPVDKKLIADDKANIPSWLKIDSKKFQGEIQRLPNRDEIENDIDEQLIIEFYSR